MKIVFASNYYNHHQSPFSEAMYSLIGDGYAFIETMPIEQERLNMGWGESKYPPFVMRSYISDEAYKDCIRIINEADIVITGSAPEAMIKDRVKAGKIVFRYSERPLKTKVSLIRYGKMLIRLHQYNPPLSKTYMLCASAYTAADFRKFGCFRNRCYKWGYFPAAEHYDNIDELIAKKKKNSVLWAGRFLDWKHPDAAIEIADRLKRDGYDFEMQIIGTGEMEEALKQMIRDKNLSDRVKMLGSMKPSQVRSCMEQSEIFLFTSDRYEGWGAVLNESMNSGCAVVASHEIGSAPFLIQDDVNGLIYRDGDIDDLYQKTKRLIDHSEERRSISKKAYETITNEWNAETAAKRLLNMAEHIVKGEPIRNLYQTGICSPAEITSDRWY